MPIHQCYPSSSWWQSYKDSRSLDFCPALSLIFLFKCDNSWKREKGLLQKDMWYNRPSFFSIVIFGQLNYMFHSSLNCGVGGSVYKNDLVLLLMTHLELRIELSWISSLTFVYCGYCCASRISLTPWLTLSRGMAKWNVALLLNLQN